MGVRPCFGSWQGGARFEEGGRKASAWRAADTALANQYIHGLEQNPEYGRVLELLWKLYDDRGQTRLLLQYFEEAAKPETAQAARIIHGHLLRRKGNNDQALEQYRAVLAFFPGSPVVLRSVAEILREEADAVGASESATAWQEATKPGTPDRVSAGLLRADSLRELKRPDQAVTAWQGLLAARPGDVDLARKIIGLFVEEGRTAEAAAGHEALARTGDAESRLDALRELGRLREAREEPDLAVAVYEQGLASLHFRHFKYDGFLTSLIRVRERFGGLAESTAKWREQAAGGGCCRGRVVADGAALPADCGWGGRRGVASQTRGPGSFECGLPAAIGGSLFSQRSRRGRGQDRGEPGQDGGTGPG